MRVLFVTPSYFPIVGGSEVLTRIVSTKLNEIGIDADVMTLNMNRKWHPVWKEEVCKDGAIDLFRVSAFNPLPNLPNPLANILRINVIPSLSFLKKLRNYDIIHFVGEADLTFPLMSLFLKKPKLIYCVGIFRHGGLYAYYTLKRPFLRGIFQSFFPHLADFFLISSEEEKELLSNLKVPEDKILILPLGVDANTFRPAGEKKVENLVLFVGRIYRIKGLHLLLKALPHIKTPIQLAVVGSRWDREYVEEVEEMSRDINERGVHRVAFIGVLDEKDLVSWYQKASVLVCPYLYETTSNVVREALACGTPVVSTGEHLGDDGSDGILLASKDPEEIAKAIEMLFNDRELRERYGKEGREFIERNLSWDSIIKNLADVYECILRSRALNEKRVPQHESGQFH